MRPAGICADICPVQWSPSLRAAQSEVMRGCQVAACVGRTGKGGNIIYLACMKRAACRRGPFLREWAGGKWFLPQSIVSGAAYAAPDSKCAAGPRHKTPCRRRDAIMRRSTEKCFLPHAASSADIAPRFARRARIEVPPHALGAGFGEFSAARMRNRLRKKKEISRGERIRRGISPLVRVKLTVSRGPGPCLSRSAPELLRTSAHRRRQSSLCRQKCRRIHSTGTLRR